MIEMEHKKSKFNVKFKDKDVEQAKKQGWTEVKKRKTKPKEEIENG